jgi:hypothetical protein
MGMFDDLLTAIAGAALLIGFVAACCWFAVWAVNGLAGALS